jgi:AcrR family transcriptional regulator
VPKVVPGYKAEARARIVEAARRLFVTRGYRRTTMDDLAAALGVSKGALYLYYRSKLEVLREIQSSNRRAARHWMEEALARADPAGNLTVAFDDVFRRSIDREQVALWFEVLGEASHDDGIREAIRVDHREDLRSLQGFLGELRRRGLLGWAGDLRVLSFMVVSLFQGAVWDLSVGFDAVRTRETLREALATLLAPPVRRAAAVRGADGSRGRRSPSPRRRSRDPPR